MRDRRTTESTVEKLVNSMAPHQQSNQDDAAPAGLHRHRHRRRRRRRAWSSPRVLGGQAGQAQEGMITLVDQSRTHLWKPLLHQVAAGSMDLNDHELDYLYQARWHHFQFRLGRMDGLDRAHKANPARADHGRGRPRSHPRQHHPLRHAGAGGGQHHQRFRHARRSRSTRSRSTIRSRRRCSIRGCSTPACAQTRRRAAASPGSCTSPSSAPAPPVWSWPRSCTTPSASSSPSGSIASIRSATSSSPSSRRRPGSCRRCPNVCRTRCSSLLKKLKVEVLTGERVTEVSAAGASRPRPAARYRPSWWCGRPVSRRRIFSRISTGWRPTASTSSW